MSGRIARTIRTKPLVFCVVSSSRVLTYLRTLRATLLLTPQNPARRLCVAILALIFSSFSLAGLNAQDDPYANIHTIGIVSLIGNTATFQHKAFVFDTSHTTIELDWDIDSKISEILLSALKSRFEVKSVPPLLGKISSIPQKDDLLVALHISENGPDFSGLSDLLKSSAAASGVDAFVVVIPSKYVSDAGPRFPPIVRLDLAQYLNGLGVYRDSNPFMTMNAVTIYATFDVVVADAKTGKVISWAYADPLGNAHQRPFSVNAECFGPWPTSPDNLSADQKQTVRAQLTKFVLKALPGTLRSMALPSNTAVTADLPPQPATIACNEPY